MYIQDSELAKTGLTREELAESVRQAILSEEYEGGLSLQTHQTCSGIEQYLGVTRDLYEQIETGWEEGDELTNLLEAQELEEKLNEWLKSEDANLDEIRQALADDEEPLSETEADELQLLANGDKTIRERICSVLMDEDLDPSQAGESDELVRLLYVAGFLKDDLGDELREQVREDFAEAPAYWTTYWRDDRLDADIAHRCRLIAFEFKDTQYLGLGGCGMDLSPRLDAYCALRFGRLPEDSKFFQQPGYFKAVVGEEVTAEVDQRTRLPQPQVVLTVPLPERAKEAVA